MSFRIRTILIDDEIDSSIAVEEQLKMYCPSIEVIGTFNDPLLGFEAVQAMKPDVVFLDIEMPKMTGLELAGKIQQEDIHIIFVTAHDRYAINAIKLSALDYLLKPIDSEELIETVERLEKLISTQSKNPNRINTLNNLISNLNENSFSQNTVIHLADEKGISYIKIKDIIRLEAQRNYSNFYFEGGKHMLVSRNIGYFFKDGLEKYNFVQVHRSHIVNKEHIRKLITRDGHHLIMSDDSTVPVSKQYRSNL